MVEQVGMSVVGSFLCDTYKMSLSFHIASRTRGPEEPGPGSLDPKFARGLAPEKFGNPDLDGVALPHVGVECREGDIC